MNRKLVSIVLVTFVIATMFTIARFVTSIEEPVEDTALEARDIKVGAYYYVWYMENWTENHSNCIDRPIIGEYSSQNATVIKKHLEWFFELGIDFLIVSWWGIDRFSEQPEASFMDDATKMLFSMVADENYPIVLAVMVEPFNSSNGRSGQYNFTTIYDYIYCTYVEPYPDTYMKLYDKPLICFFNDKNMTSHGQIEFDNSNRFESRIVGLEPYVNWTYCSVDASRWGKHWSNNTFTVKQMLCVDGEINVLPRFDDRTCNRTTDTIIDLNYTEGLYDEQWSKVIYLAKEGKVNIVTITSWNEYAERTAIEPHWDKTAFDSDPYFLYNKTKEYINILKSIFTFFVKEMLETVGDLGENQCRYNVTDDRGCRLDAVKIIENPEGGYFGVYHSNVSKVLEVRLANSTDLLHWTLIRTIDQKAAQPTITKAPNNAYITAYEKQDASYTHLRFQYYSNLSSLIIGPADATYDADRTLSSSHEGTPNVYNVTIKSSTLSACIGFHYYNGSVDNAAVGLLTIPLDNPQNMVWNNTTPLTQYNQDLRDKYQIKGNIGDRDYGQIFGRNFTLQEGNLEERSPDTNWTAWRIFLYDHSTGNFTKLSITTHFNATSFGNPTFTFLKSPNNKSCVVVTCFLFREGLPDEYKDKAGELIFYKEFETEQFQITYDSKPCSINVTSNSTISDFNFSELERSISFNVSGLDDSKGFCVVEIPKELVQNLWQNNYTVLLKGKQWPFENWTCTGNTYIYVNYVHSTHKVIITPEFTSFLVLPLFMIATLLAATVYRRKHPV